MKIGGTILLNLLLVSAGLALYHQTRRSVRATSTPAPAPAPRGGEDLGQRQLREGIEGEAQRLSRLETMAYEIRRDLILVGAELRTGRRRDELLGDERMAVLRRHVEEVERRQLVERRTKNLRIAIKQLQARLTEHELKLVLEIIQRSHRELGAYGVQLRQAAGEGSLDALEKYDEIRLRYHAQLRKLLTPKQAEAVIARFIALR